MLFVLRCADLIICHFFQEMGKLVGMLMSVSPTMVAVTVMLSASTLTAHSSVCAMLGSGAMVPSVRT